MRVTLDTEGLLPLELKHLWDFNLVNLRMAKRCHLTRPYPNEGDTLCGLSATEMDHVPCIPRKAIDLCNRCLKQHDALR